MNEITVDLWNTIREVAPVAKDSRLFGVATAEQAMMIMLKGKELGLPLTASFEFVSIIENKPSLSPRGALALILNSPLCEGVEINDGQDECTVTMKRRGGFTYTVKWTMEDAKKAGVIKTGSGWDKYPSNMLRWRCVGFCADVVFPDVIGGMKRADEFGADLDANGDVIEGSWQVGSQPSQEEDAPGQIEPPKVTRDAVSRLNELVERYGAEAIMVANEGKIPGTNEELDAIEAKLQ